MKPEKVAALTDTELLKRKKLLKNTYTFILATGIIALLVVCMMFGYSVGKDVATGGKGTFYYKPLIPFLLFFIIGSSVITSEQKSVNDEIKKRNLE